MSFQCANLDERCACLNCHFTWYGDFSSCPVCESTGDKIIILSTVESEARYYLNRKQDDAITAETLLSHAVTYEFHYGKCASDIVFLMRASLDPDNDYWFIQWGRSRWSRKMQMFIYEPPAFERDKEFIEETKFHSAEEAFKYLEKYNPLEIHKDNAKRMRV